MQNDQPAGALKTEGGVRNRGISGPGNRIVADGTVPGLAIRTTAAGHKAWTLAYRDRSGASHRLTIGDVADWPVPKARKRARELRREIDQGADPLGERHAERTAPTVNDLADRFEAEHLPRKRPATASEYRKILDQIIRPAIGKKRVAELRHADVEKMHHGVATRAPYRANRAIAVLSKMLSLGVRWEMRPDNPAHGIERAPEEKRERYLVPAEIARLGEVLAGHPEKSSANAVTLMLLTGARKGEALAAKWADIDMEAGVWSKPAATTKTARLHRIPLSAPALELLTGMKAEADKETGRRARISLPPIPYLFPSTDGKPLGDLKHFWAAVIRKADLPGVRVHDLRHTYASILAASGLSLPVIGALLGHTQASTTQRYAHLLDDPLRAATERAGAVIAGTRKPSATVHDMDGRRRA